MKREMEVQQIKKKANISYAEAIKRSEGNIASKDAVYGKGKNGSECNE